MPCNEYPLPDRFPIDHVAPERRSISPYRTANMAADDLPASPTMALTIILLISMFLLNEAVELIETFHQKNERKYWTTIY